MDKCQGLMGEIFKGTFFAILLAAQAIGLSWLTWVDTVVIMFACLALDKLVSMDQGLMGEIFKGVFFAILLAAQVIGLSWLTWVETVVIMFACLVLDKLVSRAFKNAGSKDE